MTVAQCTLVYPGLLGPSVPLEELAQSEWPEQSELPALSQLLARAQQQPLTKHAFELQLLSCLGYVISANGELPVAALRAQIDTSVTSGRLWCLDPVYIQLDREMAYLSRPDSLMLSESEAQAIIASINLHFADVMHVRYHAPKQWLVKIELDVDTKTPSQAMLQDVNRMQPAGNDAARWRGLLNEIQMLLHAHPVNEARLQAGKPPVNSVWLWGGGVLDTTASDYDVVYAEEPLAAAAARRNTVAHRGVPVSITPEQFENQNSLLILTQQLSAVQQKDVHAWLEALRQLEQQYLVSLLTMVRQGRLKRLTLCSDTLQLTADKSRLRKWWRRPKRPSISILGLRNQYGD